MSRFFSLACAVSLLLCCVFVAKHLHADVLLSAKHAVSKIISASKASQLGHRILTTTMVVAACANLLSCGDLEQEAYQHLNTNELKDPPITNELKGLPIMQGATTASQTQVFVLTAKRDNHAYSLLDGVGNEIAPALLDRDEYPGNEYVMQHMFFRGLTPDSEYLFRVHSFTGELLDERELRTLDPSRQAVRFAFGSCMSDYVPQGDIWQQMVALKPDVIFLIGDNVYTNNFSPITPPDFMWIRYVSTRRFLNLFKDRQLVPVVAVWDDHDYGMSNGDLTYPHKEEALSIFTAFFASYETDNFYMPNIGAASFFSIYGYNFFLLDNRSFRTPEASSPEWHFGKVQSQWLLDNLEGKDNAFIFSGDQFFGGYLQKDSFQGNHPDRFADFLGELKASDAKVVFLSGDRHFTEIMKVPTDLLGYQTYELTSSPLHSSYRGLPTNNPLRVAGQASAKSNFMLIEASKSGSGLHLLATAYSVGGAVLFSDEYVVE